MRTNEILIDGFQDISTLQRYLYMSEKHYIEVENMLGVWLRIRLDENLHYYSQNMNYPDSPESCFDDFMSIKTLLSIIEQLKGNPATEFPDGFESRWEEIKAITSANMVQNKMKMDDMKRRIELKGLKRVVSDYRRINSEGPYSSHYGHLMFDKAGGKIWVDEFFSVGHSSWKDYDSKKVVNIGRMMTEQNLEINVNNVKAFIQEEFGLCVTN